MCDLDSQRAPGQKLTPDTVLLIASKFSEFSDQYLLFAEFPELDDSSITAFANTVNSLDSIHNQALRGNAMGTFQSAVSIWQILARQGEIRREDLNASFQKVLKPWGKINSPVQAFDAGRASLKEIALAATDKPELSQDQIIELLAGPMQVGAEGQRMHQFVANRMRAVLDAQRLISIDTIVNLGDGLHDPAHVKAQQATLLPLAQELREFEMPQPIFKNSERDQWAAGIYNNHHTETQMKADLTKVVKAPTTPDQLAEARGQLSSLLRDTLVGLNYAYYEPPGAQILHHNTLFVSSHDFSGDPVTGVEKQAWQASQLFGAGSPAGGGARLVGSLADLPFVLADAEQDFIAPENVQALIWRQVVPGLLTSAVVPRWWGVSPGELHAVALYQRAGEELLLVAQDDNDTRATVLSILADRMSPQRLTFVSESLRDKHAEHLAAQLMPADTFYIAAEYRRRVPDSKISIGTNYSELDALAKSHPDDVSLDHLSRDFGVPHPALEQTYGRALLNVQPLPRRVVGLQQSLLGAPRRRKRSFTRRAQPARPRAHAPHGRKNLRHRSRRLARVAACRPRDRRRVPCRQAHAAAVGARRQRRRIAAVGNQFKVRVKIASGQTAMAKRYFALLAIALAVIAAVGATAARLHAQQDGTRFRISVDLVQLNVAVTDNKGNYVTGLKPSDFVISEDGITEKLATFEEGNGPTQRLGAAPPPKPAPADAQNPSDDPNQTLAEAIAGSNVFILFDTSNYMYRGFVFAQDAISDFVRSLETADKIAFYSYSRDLFRSAPLTADRSEVVRGVRTTVAGDDAALYNSLLLTLKDASTQTGRKVVVVFSNGPDNASMVPPEDVAELAQSAGIPIYMISTREARLEPVSTVVFERMTAATGGKAYFANSWRDERRAFASIRDDLGHLYSFSYYPEPNPNRGWRSINVRLVGEHAKKYHVRTRNGYRPQTNRFSSESAPSSVSQAMPATDTSSH